MIKAFLALWEKAEDVNKNRKIHYFETYIYIWGKTICVGRVFRDGYLTEWFIHNDFKNLCPKCGMPYPEPKHGDKYRCYFCTAEYKFYGARHPDPTGKVREEIREVALTQGISLYEQETDDW